MYQTIFKCVTSKKGLNRFFEWTYWDVLPSDVTLTRNTCDFKRKLKAAIIRKAIIVDEVII